MQRVATLVAVLVVLTATFIVLTGEASAHERRRVGSFLFYVGLLIEPALTYEPNAVYITIRDGISTGEVTGAEATLRATLVLGGQSIPLTLKPIDGAAGAYLASFTPLHTGAVRVLFTGNIRGETINAEFVSGPSTFNSIEPGDPAKAPIHQPDPPATDPQDELPVGMLFAVILAAGMALFVWRRRCG